MMRPMQKAGYLLFLPLVLALSGCESKLEKRRFRRALEKAYTEVHPGWAVMKRDPDETVFWRGDQVDRLNTTEQFNKYNAGQIPASDFLEAWQAEQQKIADARKRTLVQAKAEVIPILKSARWIEFQDVGAIGPPRVRDKIRPWRKKLAEELYVVLGVPEEKLGYRFASIHEVRTTTTSADAWLDRAVQNLVGITTRDPKAVPMQGNDERLLAVDFENIDGISALILDPKFRMSLLAKFDLSELGAAVPIRNVLIVFDPASFVTKKPIAARSHKLYDTQNHPGFRGLLRFDKDGISILEPGNPKKKKKKKK